MTRKEKLRRKMQRNNCDGKCIGWNTYCLYIGLCGDAKRLNIASKAISAIIALAIILAGFTGILFLIKWLLQTILFAVTFVFFI